MTDRWRKWLILGNVLIWHSYFPASSGWTLLQNKKYSFNSRQNLIRKKSGGNELGIINITGSPHFTRFHITRFTLYTRLRFLPNEFTLCNTLHVFLTLHCQKYYLSSTKLLCFTLHEFQFTRFIQKNKNRVKWGLPVDRHVAALCPQ